MAKKKFKGQKQEMDCCGKCECDKEDEIKVYFCPKCRSKDVKYIFGMGNLFGILPKMKCGKCGCEAKIFPILVTNKGHLNKLNKRSKKR